MITFETVLDKLRDLTSIELAFRYIYEHQIPYDKAETIPEFKAFFAADPSAKRVVNSVFNSLMQNHFLSESQMFHPETDIILSNHPRYHPAISHYHDFFEIQYVLAGSFTQVIAGHDASLQEGDFCFIAPNVSHELYVFEPDTFVLNLLIRKRVFPHAFINLLSSADLISNFFIRALYSEEFTPFLINHTGKSENIRYLITRMFETHHTPSPYTPQLLKAQFEELFLYLLQDHSNNFEVTTNSKANWKITLSILSYIQNNYNTVSLSELSEKFSYNPSYLSRMLHNHTGKSFSQIVKDIRFERALQLIISTDENIEDIIYNVGYVDRTYFYREFKARYNTTPGEYRKNYVSIF